MNKTLRKWAAEAACRMGYTIVPKWQEDTFAAAKYLRRLFDLLDIDCVIDVGANLGQYRTFLRTQVEYTGNIVSFEPISHHVVALRKLAEGDAHWRIEGSALGSSSGFRDFNITLNTEFSSFLEPNHDQIHIFRGANAVRDRIAVEVRMLDEVVPAIRRGGARSIYLKLDTQGFDIEVLKGARETLGEFKALQTEAAVRQIYDNMPRYYEVIRYCEERGFVMSGIFPNNSGHFPLLVDFDCYLINSKSVDSIQLL
jgi:FkbM family methyltransferase